MLFKTLSEYRWASSVYDTHTDYPDYLVLCIPKGYYFSLTAAAYAALPVRGTHALLVRSKPSRTARQLVQLKIRVINCPYTAETPYFTAHAQLLLRLLSKMHWLLCS